MLLTLCLLRRSQLFVILFVTVPGRLLPLPARGTCGAQTGQRDGNHVSGSLGSQPSGGF